MRGGPPATPDPSGAPAGAGGIASSEASRFALITEGARLTEEVAAAAEAEALGFEAVLVGETLSTGDAFLRATAILEATQTIRVGPGIAETSLRHPLALARSAAGLDRNAPGRAHLGLGRGDPAAVEAATGIPAALAGAGLEDALRICGPLLRGQRVQWRGRRWTAQLAARSAGTRRGARIPLLCAAVGERTLRLAGALADTVVLNYGAPLEYVEWAVARVTEAAAEAGRPEGEPDVAGIVLVARTDADGAERQVDDVRRTLEFVLALPDQGPALAAHSGGVPGRVDGDTLRRFAATGDGVEIARRLAAYRRAGLRCIVVTPSGMRALSTLVAPPAPSVPEAAGPSDSPGV